MTSLLVVQGLCVAVAGFLLIAIGVALGAHWRGQRAAWDHARDLQDIADLSGQLVEAERANELLVQSTLRAWHEVAAARQQARGGRPPQGFWVPEDQVEQGRRNRGLN
jgi:hypothetical protein